MRSEKEGAASKKQPTRLELCVQGKGWCSELQNETVWANAATMPPEAWYDEMYVKPWNPEFAMVGMRVLSSASSCERSWSAHGHIQTKIRNKLSTETTGKLV